ncbi:hypothetical protein A2Z67_01570 [Candidatus Woesebacteria bacterium RBG_13_36_22]|uniref:2-hydroxy-3-oxopropionate reductase n=1 Tax=Candidatus Woesebacteria bacterium RBG_13_36_22 TaxID=1802478 RepID=A0A1F7X5F9_9BACT|nr:MAG: hypothetical protein A2Z67_01570 [Candidatus Woesebacteria bacterium RBG_13_36_22]
MKVGFIGLGLMGNPMAKNILKAGFSISVYNRTLSKTAEFKKLGVKVAKTPKELAKNSDVIITMITSGKDVEQVLFGKDGVVKGAKSGLVVIDMGTIGPTYAKKIAQKLKKYHIEFIDAPVTGGTPKAITGELTIFIGGNLKTYNKVKKLLLSMGKTLFHMGGVGRGQLMKIINNQLHPAAIIALSEGMLLADSLGLSRKKVMDALIAGPTISPTMKMVLPNYVDNKYPLRFSIANLKKDVTLALQEMKKAKMNLPLLRKTQSIYSKAVRNGLSNEDFSAIIKILEK